MIVMSGIIINDSILKIDTINQLRREGLGLMEAIHEGGEKATHSYHYDEFNDHPGGIALLFRKWAGRRSTKTSGISTYWRYVDRHFGKPVFYSSGVLLFTQEA